MVLTHTLFFIYNPFIFRKWLFSFPLISIIFVLSSVHRAFTYFFELNPFSDSFKWIVRLCWCVCVCRGVLTPAVCLVSLRDSQKLLAQPYYNIVISVQKYLSLIIYYISTSIRFFTSTIRYVPKFLSFFFR